MMSLERTGSFRTGLLVSVRVELLGALHVHDVVTR